MEPRAMDVLVALCERAGEVVTSEELLLQCWGSSELGDNPIHKTITQLRRLLGDSAAAPIYIETIRKRGYRAIAPVTLGVPVANWEGESPFRGLQAFDSRHAAVFFGREAAADKLGRALARQARSGRALVLVLGPSGSGKTSLIQAGLLPLLDTGVDGLRCASVTALDLGTPGAGRLFTDLGGAMLDWQSGPALPFDGESAESLGSLLQHQPDALAARIEALPMADGERLLLFLDRFEALFASAFISEGERAALMEALDVLAQSPRLAIVAACRNDFYPRIADYPVLMQGKADGAHVDLAPPTAAEIARMVRLPAQAARLSFGADAATHARLDDVLCQSVTASPDALPLLQYTLHELYRQRSADGELPFDAFARLGGVDGAIGRRAEQVIAALGEEQRAALPRVLSLLVTVSPASDAVTSRRAAWSSLHDEAARSLATALVDARLLVSELVGQEAGFGVAHEALLRRWPRATEWIAAHRNSLLTRARLTPQASRWVDAGRPADLLLPPGTQLDEAQALAGGGLPLSPDELALVRASAGKARWRSRVRVGVMSLIAMLAVLASGLGVTAFAAKRVAEQRRADAESLVQFMLGDFADKLRPLARLDLLDSVSTKALAYLSSGSGQEHGAGGVVQRARALHVIGEVRELRGDHDGANTAFESARSLLLPVVQTHPRDQDVLKTLGANAFWLGQIQLTLNNLPAARDHFLLYRDYSDRLYAVDPDNVDNWVEQSYAHNNLGTVALKSGDTRSANAAFLLSIDLKTRALARKPADRTLASDLADSLSWLGDTRLGAGALTQALDLYERELRLASELHAAAPADSVWTEARTRALLHRGTALVALGRTADAQRDFALAEQLVTRNLALEPDKRNWQRSLMALQLEQIRLRMGERARAADLALLDALEKQADTLIGLDAANIEWLRMRTTVTQRRVALLIALGRPREARSAMLQGRPALDKLMTLKGEDKKSRITLAQSMLTEARVHALGREADAARIACTAARDTLEALAPASFDYKMLDPWVRANACLGQQQAASNAMARLSDMGYGEAAYQQYLSHPLSNP